MSPGIPTDFFFRERAAICTKKCTKNITDLVIKSRPEQIYRLARDQELMVSRS